MGASVWGFLAFRVICSWFSERLAPVVLSTTSRLLLLKPGPWAKATSGATVRASLGMPSTSLGLPFCLRIEYSRRWRPLHANRRRDLIPIGGERNSSGLKGTSTGAAGLNCSSCQNFSICCEATPLGRYSGKEARLRASARLLRTTLGS